MSRTRFPGQPKVPLDWRTGGHSQLEILLAHAAREFDFINGKIGEVTSVKSDYGAVGDGIANDAPAVQSASDNNDVVVFNRGTYLLGSSIALTSAHTGLKWLLLGATIRKGFNGSLVTNSGAQDFALEGTGTIDGQHGTYTGKGFVFSTGNSDAPYFGPGIKFTSFTDSHIEFGADAGQNAKVFSDFYPGTGQTEYRAIHFNGPDTQSMHRRIVGVMATLGYFDLDGPQGLAFTGCDYLRIEFDDNCAVVRVAGGSGELGVISGTNIYVVGSRVVGDTTLDAGLSGAFVGNSQSSGTFTDNSTSGSVAIFHFNGAGGEYTRIGKHILNNTPTVGHMIRREFSASAGDADLSWSLGTATIIRYATALTANRTITLGTTDVANGQTVSVVRTAGDTGGPWTVSVGGLKTLAQNEWCEVFYNGTAWQLEKFGSL